MAQTSKWHVTDWFTSGSNSVSIFCLTSGKERLYVSMNEDGSYNLHDEDEMLKQGYKLYNTSNANYWTRKEGNQNFIPADDKGNHNAFNYLAGNGRNGNVQRAFRQEDLDKGVQSYFSHWPAAGNALSPAHIDRVAADAKWQQKGIEKVDQSEIRAFYNSGHQYIAVPLVENAGNIGNGNQYKVFEISENGTVRQAANIAIKDGVLQGIGGSAVYETTPSEVLSRISRSNTAGENPAYKAYGNMLGEFHKRTDEKGKYAYDALKNAGGMVTAPMNEADQEHLRKVGGLEPQWFENWVDKAKDAWKNIKSGNGDFQKNAGVALDGVAKELLKFSGGPAPLLLAIAGGAAAKKMTGLEGTMGWITFAVGAFTAFSALNLVKGTAQVTHDAFTPEKDRQTVEQGSGFKERLSAAWNALQGKNTTPERGADITGSKNAPAGVGA